MYLRESDVEEATDRGDLGAPLRSLCELSLLSVCPLELSI